MTPGMKMMMLERVREKPEMPRTGGYPEPENRRDRKVGIDYEETYAGYEPESRNRRRYRDGRYAPRQEMDGYYPMESRYNEPWGERPEYRRNDDGNRMAGFDMGYDMKSHGDTRKQSKTEMGHGESMEHNMKNLDQHTAKEWVENMGECFTMEETMEALKKRKCRCDPLEFWVITNAMKSDYPKLGAKYGVDHIDFYADMAVEWLEDRDAKPGKAANYWKYIVKHE